MFKPTAPLQKMLRRLPLSPKQAGKEYYKGNRVGSMGTIDRWGRFSPDWSKVRTYVYPVYGADGGDLTPFVDSRLEKVQYPNDPDKAENYAKRLTGEDYLRAWKLAGGNDEVVGDGYGGVGETRRNMPVPFEERPASKTAKS